MSIDKYISPYIASQFPRLYREEGPAFIQFVKAYYEWMELQGGVIHESKRLGEYRDIDTTLDEFLVHFKNKYMTGLPEDALGDKRTLQKHIKEIYSSKGTARGLELLFRLLYNESSEIYYPGDDILRPSDGIWVQPVYLEVSVNPYNVLLIGEKVTGRESRATAIVEDFQVRYINKRQINVLFLSNVRGDFQTNEIILSGVVSDPLKSPSVIGSMTDILVNESGFGFKVGDTLEVGGGSGLLGKAIVSSVSPRNGAVSFTINKGGSGYANNNIWAPNTISVVAVDMDNPGIGADFEIGELANTEVITTAVDSIAPYANVAIGAPDYGFPTNVGVENINTPLNQALNIQNITVGTIKSLRAINPGAGYNGPVIVTVDNSVISGLMIEDDVNGNYKGNNAVITGKAAAGNGAIDTVKIINSGVGYANGDIVTLLNANVPFNAGGSVLLGKQGKGEGFWKDTRSFLNSDKYIQDSFYYQEYSYETRLSVAFSYYSDLLKKLWHPAGTQGFGKFVISNIVDSESEAVEVDIVATRITEYLTLFSTYLVTDRSTSSGYVTQYATAYPTERATSTSRSTSADYLVNQPNLVINGAFNVDTDSWFPWGNTSLTFANNAGRIAAVGVDGSAAQRVSTSNAATYQLDLTFTNANGAVTVYAARSNSVANAEVLVSGSFSGTSNTVQLTFDAQGANTYIIVAAANTVDIDNVQLRNVPTLTQLTEFVTAFSRETSVDEGTRLTQFNTNTGYDTIFNTAFNTVFNANPLKLTSFITQILTGSQVATNRITDRATSTIYNTSFDTVRVTDRATGTSRNTAFATDRATTTAYDTLFNTTFVTNRDTTTAYNTTFDTVFATNRATNTIYGTTFATSFATNIATTTTFATNRATTTTFDTSRATGTSRATATSRTTTFDTTLGTSGATNTSRGTTYATTYGTTFGTTYQTFVETTQETWCERGENSTYQTIVQFFRDTTADTVRQTSRDTTKTTTFATTTAFVTSFGTSRTTTFDTTTAFNTTTVFATNFLTTSVFNTNRATTSVFDTSRNTTVDTTRSTSTVFDTTLSTNRATSKVTNTLYDTIGATNFATTRSTGTIFDTVIATSFDTTTAFNTTYATDRSTDRSTLSLYATNYLTGTIKLTDIVTSRSTATTVPTVVTTATSRSTNRATTRATLTSRTTNLLTQIATNVNRDTSRTTIFVAYPTSFMTTFNTGTTIATDYQTLRATAVMTDTEFDTAYATDRLTAVLTATDVATE